MSEPLPPTLLYPNGGESIVGNDLTITWQGGSGPDSRPIMYEIFYTDKYDYKKEPEWRQIATVPSTSTSYLWRFGKALKSNACRVAIRTRNARGEKSSYSISAGNFTIQRKKLNPPTILNPVGNTHYDRYIEIITDDSGVLGTFSQRSYYQFFYSSAAAQIPPTAIRQNVPVGGDPVFWNTSTLPPADDYVLQCYLSDDDGNVSDSVFIRGIKINHEGFFIVDTTPPIASIVVNNNATFTTTRDVNVNIVSYDETTGVHSLILTDGTTTSRPDAIADTKRFVLSATNAVKTVQAKLQDFGANRSGDSGEIQRIFENTIELSGTKIIDLAVDRSTNTAWCITSGTGNYLYEITDFPARKATVSANPTAVAFFKNSPYVASQDNTYKGIFQRYDGSELTDTKEFDEVDSIINTMEVHGDHLFLGMENGLVYRFDGLSFDIVDELDNPIEFMFSDGNLLYLVEKNNLQVYAFNGTSFFITGD